MRKSPHACGYVLSKKKKERKKGRKETKVSELSVKQGEGRKSGKGGKMCAHFFDLHGILIQSLDQGPQLCYVHPLPGHCGYMMEILI